MSLDFEAAYLLGIYAISLYNKSLGGIFSQDRRTAEIQSTAAFCTFHTKETYRSEAAAEQIAGVCAAVFDYDIGTSENGFLEPDVEYAMDNCGMGGAGIALGGNTAGAILNPALSTTCTNAVLVYRRLCP